MVCLGEAQQRCKRLRPIQRRNPVPVKNNRPRSFLNRIQVRPTVGAAHSGKMIAGALVVPCTLGNSGISNCKREGDGATPAGAHRLIRAYFRPDRFPRFRAPLRMTALTGRMAWCDDACSRRYNRPVTLPFRGSHEVLLREDGLYDLVVVLDYNLNMTVSGKGSAIFLHLTSDPLRPTKGCIAISDAAARRLLPRFSRACRIWVSR